MEEIKYVIDVENLMKFIFESDIKRDVDSEITETYLADENNGDMLLTSKQYREVKGGDNTSKQTIRYDFFKSLIELLEDTDGLSTMSFREKLAFNTLFNEGLIKIINIE